jgi:hypothetical protein
MRAPWRCCDAATRLEGFLLVVVLVLFIVPVVAFVVVWRVADRNFVLIVVVTGSGATPEGDFLEPGRRRFEPLVRRAQFHADGIRRFCPG